MRNPEFVPGRPDFSSSRKPVIRRNVESDAHLTYFFDVAGNLEYILTASDAERLDSIKREK
jgi:hypothetical protein